MSAARWQPDDDALDATARTLDAAEPSADRAEQIRTSLLAGAAVQRQLGRRSPVPFVFAGAALAAAAAIVIWVARPQPAPAVVAVAPKQVVTPLPPLGAARFDAAGAWPDFVVRLDEGRIDVRVAKLDAGERFRVTTADAEVEVRGTHFEVGASADHLTSVIVTEGRVEVRRKGEPVVILSASQRWDATQTATREELSSGSPGPAPTAIAQATTTPPTPPPTTTTTPTTPPPHDPTATRLEPPGMTSASPAKPPAGPAKPSATSSKRIGSAAAPTVMVPPVATSPVVTPITPPVVTPVAPAMVTPPAAPSAKPGEAEFRAGMAALRAGDASAAAKAFSTACGEALHDALGEDACFWTGAAAKRAGDAAMARGALEQFLKQFPSSSRAAEASALLGWLLYDAGELNAAERWFQRAEHDRVPQVSDSAKRGLTAIQRRRATP